MTGIRRVSQLGTTGESTYVDGSIKAVDIAANVITQDKLSTDIPLSGFRNVIINGDMRIAQRSTSVASITSGESYRTVDRFVSAYGTTGTWTESQSTDAPPGFGNSIKFQCTTANASLSSSSYLIFGQNIEGQNIQQFAKGTSSAKPFTFSFWVKAFQTGTYVAELYDNTNSRQVTRTFTINASATWEYKTIQFPADTTGAFANSNANALSLFFWLVAGTTFTSGSSGSWASASNGNRAAGLTVNGASSTSNYFQFTGLQLEQNYQPTPFEQRPIGTELALCQRYYFYSNFDTGTGNNFADGYNITGGYITQWINFPQTMRMRPTSVVLNIGSVSNTTTFAATAVSPSYIQLYGGVVSTGRGYYYINNISASAEL